MSYIKFLKNDARYYLSSWYVVIYILLLILTYFKIIPLNSILNQAIYIIMWISAIIGFILIYLKGHIVRKRINTDKSLRYILFFIKFLIILLLLSIRPYKNTKINLNIILQTISIIIIYLGIYISYLKLNNKSLIYLYGF